MSRSWALPPRRDTDTSRSPVLTRHATLSPLAASLAAFIVGNYTVMNDTEVPDAVFRTAVRQLRRQPGLRELGRHLKDDQLRTLYDISLAQ